MATVINTLIGRKSRRGKKGKSKSASQKRSATVVTPKTSTIPSLGSAATKNDNVDVRSKGQVSQLLDLIKKNKIVVVLVYADWCGHCQHYKKDTWNKVQSLPNRKVPIAQVNADVLDSTPLKSAKIEGYPSVIAIGNDGKMAGFKNEMGEQTNAIPNHSDMNMLKSMLTADPSKVLAASGATPASASNSVTESEPEPSSKAPTPSAEQALNDAGDVSVASLASNTTKSNKTANQVSANPPNVEDDLVGQGSTYSQMPASPMGSPTPVGSPTPIMENGMPLNSQGSIVTSGPNSQTLSGGSLLAAMWDAAGRVAPAALLAGTAVAISSRRKTVKRAARMARRRRARARAAAMRVANTRKN